MVIMLCLSALRWQLFAPSLLPYGTALKYTWIGLFYSHILPGALSGDVAKGVSLALRDREARVSALPVSILADKILGLVVLVLFFNVACGLVYVFDDRAFAVLRRTAVIVLLASFGGLIVGAAVATVLLRARPTLHPDVSGVAGLSQRVLIALYRAATFCIQNPATAWKAVGLSAAVHSLNILAFYVSLRSLGIAADLFLAALVYPVLAVILMIPVSISGIGVREATLVTLFQLFGLSAAAAVASAWLSLIASVPNVVIGGILQLGEMYRK
jgi:uncharacterized protein (TIRG00374 family)